jgi:hypothetical protein
MGVDLRRAPAPREIRAREPEGLQGRDPASSSSRAAAVKTEGRSPPAPLAHCRRRRARRRRSPRRNAASPRFYPRTRMKLRQREHHEASGQSERGRPANHEQMVRGPPTAPVSAPPFPARGRRSGEHERRQRPDARSRSNAGIGGPRPRQAGMEPPVRQRQERQRRRPPPLSSRRRALDREAVGGHGSEICPAPRAARLRGSGGRAAITRGRSRGRPSPPPGIFPRTGRTYTSAGKACRAPLDQSRSARMRAADARRRAAPEVGEPRLRITIPSVPPARRKGCRMSGGACSAGPESAPCASRNPRLAPGRSRNHERRRRGPARSIPRLRNGQEKGAGPGQGSAPTGTTQ